MQSQLTVRLPNELDSEVSRIAKKLHLKRSDIVRMALEKFLGEFEGKEETRPYDKVKSLLGSFSSGVSDLGESHRKHLIQRFKKNA